ncbi:MAG: tetratricopeptide repeat protein, partial [Candidatus Eisenbacteria bacterium]
MAQDVDVDRVVTGTLLRSGDQVQATAQLVEAPGGTLLTSLTVVASLGDLFKLQNDIARRVVEGLSPPLAGAATPTPDRPRDAEAYALYLRANELARTYEGLPAARELYERCVELDSRFAPAWAQLGRCLHVIGKYIDAEGDSTGEAEDALQRALELNPRLTVAHKLYAILEADKGHAARAMTRLLHEASRHGNDPELFAGLVHACRYGGLFEQSMAAHHEARRLDPNVPTSYPQTVLMTGDVDTILAHGTTGPDDVIRVIGFGFAGRRAEAREDLLRMREPLRIPAFRAWRDFLLAWLDRDPEDMRRRRENLRDLRIMEDPEAMFQEGWLFC